MICTHRPSRATISITLSLTAILGACSANTWADTATDGSTTDAVTAGESPRAIWHQDIGSLYQQLVDTSTRLHEATQAHCASDGSTENTANSSTENLQAHWLDAYRAWQAVRFVDFGPIELESRAWQLQFWPDDKNLVGTRMAARLREEAAPTAQKIAQAGVAEKGFPALEYLFYDDAMSNAALDQPVACGLAEAVSAHIQKLSTQLATDWQDFGPHYLATDSDSEATVHGAMQLLDIMEDKRLGKPLGMMGSPANAYRAEAWRSDASVALLEASLAGLKDGFLPGLRAYAAAQGAPDANHTDLLEAFDTQLDHTLAQAGALEDGIASGLENANSQQALGSLYLNVAQLRELLNRQIAAELGIVRGFNSSDGD